LLEIPFTHDHAKKKAFDIIREQMIEEKMPLDKTDEKRLKYGLLLSRSWTKWMRENQLLLFSAVIVLLLIAVVVVVMLIFNSM
jgi:hypothetical protein